MANKLEKLKNLALPSITFVLCLITITFALAPAGWRPLAYGAAFIFFIPLVHQGIKIFTTLNKTMDIIFHLSQILLSIALLTFSILENIMLFIVFSIFLLIVFMLSIYLKFKKGWRH